MKTNLSKKILKTVAYVAEKEVEKIIVNKKSKGSSKQRKMQENCSGCVGKNK